MKLKIIFLLFIFLILVSPLITYVYYFNSFNISNSTEDWGVFGDFIGGVVNTIISLISLIILAYISWTVSKFSSDENKKLYILQRRIEAYDELIKYLPKLHISSNIIQHKFDYIRKYSKRIDESSIPLIDAKIEDISKEILFYHEYYYFLFNFNVRYNHIFKYNFKGEDFNDLIISSKNFCNSMDSLHKSFSIGKDPILDIQDLFDSHINCLIIFINELKKEID